MLKIKYMKSLTSAEIFGTWGAVLLPIQTDDSIDYSILGRHVDALILARLNGLYTNGSAGEFHAQTEEEFDRISLLVAERCEKGSVPFQIGVSHMSAQISRERLRRAKALAPSAFQVIIPDWVPTSFSETEVFLQTMAELADPIGIILYTPSHAKRPLDITSIARLRTKIPNLLGVKMSDGHASWYAAMRRELPNFSVFVPGHHLATGTLGGASGSYSNVACLNPKGALHWAALMKVDPLAALAFEARILEFFQCSVMPIVADGYCPAALDKALCAAGGWCEMPSRMRWPYRSVEDNKVMELAEAARRALPELWLEA